MITDTQFCKDFHLDLEKFRIAYQMILNGATSAQIMEETGFFYSQISKVSDWLIQNTRLNCDFIKELNLKSNQSVLNDIELEQFNYESLSPSEKKIYNSKK
jgi:hypothetical protein